MTIEEQPRAVGRSMILLVMQSLDNSLTSYRKRGRLLTRPGTGAPNPAWIPLGHEVNQRCADLIGGDAHGLVWDVFDTPPSPRQPRAHCG